MNRHDEAIPMRIRAVMILGLAVMITAAMWGGSTGDLLSSPAPLTLVLGIGFFIGGVRLTRVRRMADQTGDAADE